MDLRRISIPTGDICIMNGEKGRLEFLSIGDYGRGQNVKADFLGLTEDISGVPGGDTLPLEDKWVVTLSTQYGCSMGCKFCDVPKVGPGVNATYYDMLNQIKFALALHPEVKRTDRLNIHFARMGEPTFNGNVLDVALCLKRHIYPLAKDSLIHPVISTMMPKRNKHLMAFLEMWTKDIKNGYYGGDAGLQFSINSTSNTQRAEMFSGSSLTLEEISEIGKLLPAPLGRKYALNFALADDYEVDAKRLSQLFSPDRFMVKITPLHMTKSCETNGIITTGGYDEYTPYKEAEATLKNAGFDVLVFIPSYDEDLGRITCGNAILSGSLPEVPYTEGIVKMTGGL